MMMQQRGYILMLTLMIVSLSVAMLTYITYRAAAYTPFARATIDREKAYQLAVGGVNVACAQLAQEPKKDKKEKDEGAAESKEASEQEQTEKETPTNGDKDHAQSLLKFLLPVKNRWQTFALKKSSDGINATLQICIVSEDGKVDINEIYDFERKKFVGEGTQRDAKKMVQALFDRIKSFVGGADLFPAFEKFLKDRQYKLHDVTQLLTIKEFEVFKRRVFYEPAEQKNERGSSEKHPIYLTDIFTVWSGKQTIDPWLLSDSMSTLLELSSNGDRKEQMSEALKKFKPNLTWPADWETIFAPLYGKTFDTLAKDIAAYLNTKFAPTTFCVISLARVGKVTQKVVAILDRHVTSQDGDTQIKVTIKKLYWL